MRGTGLGLAIVKKIVEEISRDRPFSKGGRTRVRIACDAVGSLHGERRTPAASSRRGEDVNMMKGAK